MNNKKEKQNMKPKLNKTNAKKLLSFHCGTNIVLDGIEVVKAKRDGIEWMEVYVPLKLDAKSYAELSTLEGYAKQLIRVWGEDCTSYGLIKRKGKICLYVVL